MSPFRQTLISINLFKNSLKYSSDISVGSAASFWDLMIGRIIWMFATSHCTKLVTVNSRSHLQCSNMCSWSTHVLAFCASVIATSPLFKKPTLTPHLKDAIRHNVSFVIVHYAYVMNCTSQD